MRLATGLIAILGFAAPVAARGEGSGHFLFTGDGIAEGEDRFGFGIAVLTGDAGSGSFGALPMFDVRYGRGLAGPIDLRLSLDTLFIYNSFDAGVGIALAQTPSFGLGARAGVSGTFIIAGAFYGVIAATPGLVATLRGETVAFSLGADVPMYLNGFVISTSGANTAAGFVPSIRPCVTFEAGLEAKFYLRGEMTIYFVSAESPVLATISAGVHF